MFLRLAFWNVSLFPSPGTWELRPSSRRWSWTSRWTKFLMKLPLMVIFLPICELAWSTLSILSFSQLATHLLSFRVMALNLARWIQECKILQRSAFAAIRFLFRFRDTGTWWFLRALRSGADRLDRPWAWTEEAGGAAASKEGSGRSQEDSRSGQVRLQSLPGQGSGGQRRCLFASPFFLGPERPWGRGRQSSWYLILGSNYFLQSR